MKLIVTLTYANISHLSDIPLLSSHGSDAVESAKHEIALWFTEQELNQYKREVDAWIYE